MFDRFDEAGPSGLYDRERDGLPKKITEEEVEYLLERNRTEEGDNATRWTTDRIAEHLDRELTVDFHPETVRAALDRLDCSWTRPRRELSLIDLEAYRKRLSTVVEAVAEALEESYVWIEDETTLNRFPPLWRVWQPVGDQPAVLVPEENDDFTLYGILELTSDRAFTQAFEKGRSDYTIGYLDSLLEQTKG